jgi:hypothetical protein
MHGDFIIVKLESFMSDQTVHNKRIAHTFRESSPEDVDSRSNGNFCLAVYGLLAQKQLKGRKTLNFNINIFGCVSHPLLSPLHKHGRHPSHSSDQHDGSVVWTMELHLRGEIHRYF